MLEVVYEVFITEKTVMYGARIILMDAKRKKRNEYYVDIQWGTYLEDANRKL